MATKSPTFIVKAWNLFKSDEENIRSSYNSLKTLDIAHERIHQGRMFRHTEVHSLAAAGVYNHLIIPNSGSDNHLQSVAVKADQGIVHIGIYENGKKIGSKTVPKPKVLAKPDSRRYRKLVNINKISKDGLYWNEKPKNEVARKQRIKLRKNPKYKQRNKKG